MHIMLDIETLSTSPNAVVTQVAWAGFDPYGEHLAVLDQESCSLDVQSQIDAGAHVDWSTIRWWLGQSELARAAMMDPQPQFAVRHFMNLFTSYMARMEREVGPVTLWCNPASFDEPILRSMWRRHGLIHPWRHDRVRCVKTLASLAPDALRPLPPEDKAHIALEDVKAQIGWVHNCYELLAPVGDL